MYQVRQIIRNETQRYTLIGVCFGLLFPVIATIIRILSDGLPANLTSISFVQSTDPLLWIIDTAPLFLGYFAYLAGRRQDRAIAREVELIQKEQELTEAQSTLEQRVDERTKDLEDQSQRLRVVAEIAKDATSLKNFSELLERAGQLIQERFGYYHTGFFIIDANNEFAVLTSSPTEAGKNMIDDGHKLRVGYTGIVGRVASTGEPKVVLDTNLDPSYYNNPFLPNTRSEMALPLKVENNIIGVMDVQSNQPQAFTDDDVAIIQILADQIAVAIERARLVQQLEQSLVELQQSYGKRTREEWKSIAESGLMSNFGYRFDNIRIQPVNEAPQLGTKAMQEGNRVTEINERNQESVSFPIKLRGQSIGAVTIKLKDGYRQSTVGTIEQAVERLAGSLENARLFDEARQRADREQAIAQVTTAISSATDFDDILRTAVEEIGKSLGESEVSIQIVSDLEQPSN